MPAIAYAGIAAVNLDGLQVEMAPITGIAEDIRLRFCLIRILSRRIPSVTRGVKLHLVFPRGDRVVAADPIEADVWRRNAGMFVPSERVRVSLHHTRMKDDRFPFVLITPANLIANGHAGVVRDRERAAIARAIGAGCPSLLSTGDSWNEGCDDRGGQ